jgi:hypothetical protein
LSEEGGTVLSFEKRDVIFSLTVEEIIWKSCIPAKDNSKDMDSIHVTTIKAGNDSLQRTT